MIKVEKIRMFKERKGVKERVKLRYFFSSFFLLFVFLSCFVYAQKYYSSTPQEYQTFFPSIKSGFLCNETQNFLVYVDPIEGCKPSPVRSDLIEDQPTVVFCKLKAMNLNPLLQNIYIKNIYMSIENKSDLVKGVSFHMPYFGEKFLTQQMYGYKQGIATMDNIGYAVIFLSQQPDEKKIPDKIFVNGTAKIEYTASYLFGIDKNTFLIPEMEKDEWKERASEFSFFNGKGFIRVKKIYGDTAEIEIYKEINDPIPYNLILKKGESAKLLFWGFFCENQEFEILLDSLEIPKTAARIMINGEEHLLYENDEVDGCRVISIEPSQIKGGGTVLIKCDGKTAKLILEPISVKLKISKNGEEKFVEAGIGDAIFLDKKKAYLVCADENSAYLFYKEGIKEKEVSELMKKINYEKGKISCKGIEKSGGVIEIGKNEEENVDDVKVKVEDIKIFYDKTLNAEVEKSFDETKSKYYELFYTYRKELGFDNEYIGAKALYEFAELAEEIGKRSEAINALSLIEEEYSDRPIALKAKKKKLSLINFDYVKASQTIEKDGRYWNIKLISLESPYASDIKARISVDGEEREVYVLSSLEGGWIVKEISDYYVEFENIKEEKRLKVSKGKQECLPIKEECLKVRVIDISIKKVAKIVVKPPDLNLVAESNFSLHIGIEKRAIKIAPEKALEIAKKLNETIKKLEDINKKVEKTVSTWQKACWIGGTALFLKNFVSGVSGEALARKIAMRGVDGKGGWTKICEEKVKEERDINTLTECYRKYEKEINKDVEKIKSLVEEVNDIIKERKKECEKITNREKYIDCIFNGGVAKELGDNNNEILKNLTKQGYFFEDKLKDILLSKKISECKENECSKEIKNLEEKKLNEILNYYGELHGVVKDMLFDVVDLKELPVIEVSLKKVEELGDEKIKKCLSNNEKKSQYYFVGRYGGSLYYIGVTKQDRTINIVKVCNNAGNEESEIEKEIREKIIIKEAECKAIESRYRYVSFFNVPPNVNRVGYMPIDIANGYYAFVENKPDSYYENGAVKEFWLCNVGSDGVPQLLAGDTFGDYCIFVSPQTLQSYYSVKVCEKHLPLSVYIEKAAKCIAEANQQKRIGQAISTSCGSFKAQIQTPIETKQCEDFMSPTDCRLLFNLCDPVLCPPSRCNLGGRYYVDNVVKTGIIGSLVLCLPNFEGGKGVLMPICLTGIHAGLDNLIHILKETSKCFEVSAKTGQNIGFCDQLKSFYLCDLMWRELTPFIKAGIPAIVSKIERRGGGEYAKFSEAWKNTFDGLSYFVQVYGVTASEAFKVRSTAEIGKMVCGKFYGIKYPKASSILEELGKPPSPYQFFAKVDEIPYTEVTYPPQSHYKVFYYIYAGTDQDIWYSIYLKNPPTYPGIYVSDVYVLTTGFLARGQSIAESPDFLAVSGYKEICVNINGKEECGFEVVSSSYAVNWLQDKYIEDQLKRNIKSREECISGKPSLVPTASLLNLQAGIEKAISPAIYREGIIRVCSSFNPGKGVEEENWKVVGQCDAKTNCWLYLPSVKQALKDLGIENQTIKWAEERHKEILGLMEMEIGEEEIKKLIRGINEKVKGYDTKISEIKKEIIEKGKVEEKDIEKIIEKIDESIKDFERERIKILDPDALKEYDQNLAKLYKFKTLLLFYKHHGKEIIKEEEGEKEVSKGKEGEEEGEMPEGGEKEEGEIFLYKFVSGNKSEEEFREEGRIIEYGDKDTIICVIIRGGGKWVNSYLASNGKKVKGYLGNQIEIEEPSKTNNIKIQWQIIMPEFIHIDKNKNCNRVYKSEVKKGDEYECSKDVYWIQLGGKDYEIIEYKTINVRERKCVDEGCWCIYPEEENGTYWYRAIIEIKEKRIIAGPRFLSELNEKEKEEYKSINQIYKQIKGKGYKEEKILADHQRWYSSDYKWNENEKEWYYAGLITIDPEKSIRISRKSNFGLEDEHREWCEKKENEKRCELIRLLETYYNVPYVEWHPQIFGEKKIKIDGEKEIVIDIISDAYLAAECASHVNTTLVNLKGNDKLWCGSLGSIEKGNKEYYFNKEGEKIKIGEVEIKSGDLLHDEVSYYTVIDENVNGVLDLDDSILFYYFRGGRLVKTKIGEVIKFLRGDVELCEPFEPSST